MDEYVGCIRQHVLERMDLSREMSDEEIENLIGEEASRLMQEEPISIRERLMLEARVFNSLRKLDALQELLDDPEISEIMVNGPKHIFTKRQEGFMHGIRHLPAKKNAGCDTADRWKT